MADNGEKSSAFTKLDCIIITNSDIPIAYTNGISSNRNQIIYGKIVLRARKPITIKAVACRFEGRAKSILSSKYADRVAVRGSSYYFYVSPLTTLTSKQEIANGNENPETFTVTTSGIEFPFQLPVDPKATLPAAFSHALGSIKYHLSVHAQGEESTGFYPVSKTAVQLCPQRAKIPRNIPDYFVTTRRGGHVNGNYVEAELKLPADVYVKGDTIKFKLRVKNRNGGRIQSIKVALMKKSAFYAERFSKSEFVEVVSRELRNSELTWVTDHDYETFLWDKSLVVPVGAAPSFVTSEKCIEILYFMQFIVTIIGKGQLQGEKQIVIATHALENPRPLPRSSLSLSGANSHFDSPPPYSSFRIGRKPSCETLPPSYEELVPDHTVNGEEV